MSRCHAWLRRLVDDHAYDEWEEDMEPTSRDPDVTRVPETLIDEMLRGDVQERGQGQPTAI